MKSKTKGQDIPVVILCGGRGTRLGRLAADVPKPLLEVAGRPILWHIMKVYAAQGYRRFILCLGYKGAQIIRYFKGHKPENWQISFVHTGANTLKSERISRIRDLIKGDNFFLAYGDDLADIRLDRLLETHLKARATVTITAVKMFSIFGVAELGRANKVVGFREKPYLDKWMNGGFMVANRRLFGFLKSGELEKEVFERLIRRGELFAYRHPGQWKTMNTLKDNLELNAIWKKGRAFWKVW